MAEARLLRKKISKSERVNSLPIPARLLFTWMIPHLDVEGRMTGNAKIIKQVVIPLTNYTPIQVDKWLDMMVALKDDMTGKGLITRYTDGAGEKQYIAMEGFATEQSPRGGQAWKSWEPPSDIPPPPGTPEDTPIQTKKQSRADSTDDILDPVFKQLVVDYESNIGMLSPMLSERLKSIHDEYPEGWFAKAVNEAVTYNKRNLKYIERILERWKTEGIDPLSEQPQKPAVNSHERMQEYKFD